MDNLISRDERVFGSGRCGPWARAVRPNPYCFDAFTALTVRATVRISSALPSTGSRGLRVRDSSLFFGVFGGLVVSPSAYCSVHGGRVGALRNWVGWAGPG